MKAAVAALPSVRYFLRLVMIGKCERNPARRDGGAEVIKKKSPRFYNVDSCDIVPGVSVDFDVFHSIAVGDFLARHVYGDVFHRQAVYMVEGETLVGAEA